MPVKTKSRVPENMGITGGLVDARDKQVLKEAVEAVVNSFAKHTQGYGRGITIFFFLFNIKFVVYYFIFSYSKCGRSFARVLANETK